MKWLHNLIELTIQIQRMRAISHTCRRLWTVHIEEDQFDFILEMKWFRRSLGVMFWATKTTNMGAQTAMKAYHVAKKGCL